ncbi:type I-D CRISPR-associated protein Cas5/Csc1 [Anabaena sp. UHCC 0451]|uniref:type I-D CRISPR-associated protein Cas5/Csc1 n=1 Tax=Anabaena sp. UHCC 0451 TaxID=2055235 RepID=UPI002B20727E|nr:type I-D CRISPR-associated protein Cas5/Csc1 [Anabaena sp. UHCC 0451]MEA5574896.1 type I-D CRISPR-associated protein Cas5/Csc1 [Anabaena sp. UHCC 0451]
MLVYRCQLTLWENTFFSSREINDLYLTEPLIGNYALAYALGLAQSPYKNRGEIYYYEHLSQLNEKEIYITPATIPEGEEPKFSFSQFNSIPDGYWYAMGKNCLVQRPDGFDSEYDTKNKIWYIVDRKTGKRKKEKAVNYPQIGFIKMMGIGTTLNFFVVSNEDLSLPRYLRLGKFMSKAKLTVTLNRNPLVVSRQYQKIGYLLNPLDLPKEVQIMSFDTYNIHPVPLIRNAILTGEFIDLSNDVYLPIGMRFGVDFLQPSKGI